MVKIRKMDKMLTQSIIKQNKILKETIEENLPEVLSRYPVTRIISFIQSCSPLENYNHLHPELIESLKSIKSDAGSRCYALYHKYILLSMMERNQSGSIIDSLPRNIQILVESWFYRIIGEFDTNHYTYYCHEKDAFLKDLGVCSGRLIPIGGAWVIELSGISRRFLLKLKLTDLIKNFLFLLRLKGFHPFFQIHTVFNLTHLFNEKEREVGYRNIALLLEQNRQVKGLFASSWLYDPELGKVSPRLKYLASTPTANGARCFLVGSSKADTNGALLKSSTRRRLFAQGKYTPTAYIKIWPRKDLIHWVKNRFEVRNV